MRELTIILHDIRSTYNVGALLRTADGLGVQGFYMSGYTPYPTAEDDERLPHLARKLSDQIDKTALGAAKTVDWKHVNDVSDLITALKKKGYVIAALEQTPTSVLLPTFKPPKKLAIIVGNEVKGVDKRILDLTDLVIEIPMLGKKESFNVAAAGAIFLYHCRFYPDTD